MNKKKYIPNLITGLNAASGAMSVFMALYGELVWAACFILIGMVFDFFDGMVARLLHVKSDMGKELDSLADVISFGVAPALLAHLLIRELLLPEGVESWELLAVYERVLLFVPLLIPVFSAFRLAKFNLDTRQSVSFIGLPVPAHALFWVTLVFTRLKAPEFYSAFFGNVWELAICTVILSLLLVSELPMFSLKISGFGWQENKSVYMYFGTLVVLAMCCGWMILPFIIPLYILFCAVNALCNLPD
ncbi:CDP-diacylglycerol--serine O-phosphatidyltransferase [Odoribacter lunatus]|uniref:CDP-diacylglycerol--serine O-phosphatidyltransferase n=1 Tax=Odoribacter lunatus TaxID=2941335 RepID=UPI0020420432|nr:CDP-diacylglycerol--serine O-phosphatidyltransferase [Odoribacter lunatus]